MKKTTKPNSPRRSVRQAPVNRAVAGAKPLGVPPVAPPVPPTITQLPVAAAAAPQPLDLAATIQRAIDLRKEAGLMYRESDDLEDAAIRAIQADVSIVVTLADGRNAKLVDTFVDAKTGLPKYTAFKTIRQRRFSFDVL